jgi:predicted enzyme related to lactoylglutathione lyase
MKISKTTRACAGFLRLLVTALLAACIPCHAEGPELPPLTTVKGNPRLPGKFIWADLVTDDLAAARTFYQQLFNWRFAIAGNYSVVINDSHPIAGLFQKARPANDPKAKPRWFGYISVSNVKKAEKKVLDAGGKTLIAPQDFPKRGEQAVFADPEGAIFGVMKSSSGDPEDTQGGLGDWIWIQLLSRDGRKAGEFYQAVCGYEVIENTTANRLNDYVLVSKGYARATVRTIPAARTEVNPTWLPYVRVADVSQTAARARQLGGTVLVEPKPELLEGKVAVIADPTGAAVGILSWFPETKEGSTNQ